VINAVNKGLYVCALLVLISAPRHVHAQGEVEPDVNWAYASFFGTGWYKISDERDVFSIRVSPRWETGDAGFDDEGNREIGYTFRVPFTVGLARLDFDDIPGILDSENFTSTSIGFGFDADIPINRRLSLRPVAEVGYATIINESRYAWTYKAAVRARYGFEQKKFDWALVGGLGVVGFTPNEGSSDNFAYAKFAAEFEHPTQWSTRDGNPLFFYWHLAYTDFIDEVEFRAGEEKLDSVANYWQIGASLGREGDPIRIWRLKFDRLGLGYNYSTTGELRGIKIFFRSLYDL